MELRVVYPLMSLLTVMLLLFSLCIFEVAREYSFSVDCAATHHTLSLSDLEKLTSYTELMSIEDPASEEE